MATVAAQDAKLRFLEYSAQAYASTSASSMSAHLMRLRDSEASISSHAKKQASSVGSCKACGMLLMPGLTSRTTIESSDRTSIKNSKARRAKPAITRERDQEKWVRIECLICHRYTKSMLDAVNSRKDERRPAPTASVGQGPAATSFGPRNQLNRPSVNTSSKQRAKARKQGSLSALLEKSKMTSNASSGLELDLMDLMKHD